MELELLKFLIEMLIFNDGRKYYNINDKSCWLTARNVVIILPS